MKNSKFLKVGLNATGIVLVTALLANSVYGFMLQEKKEAEIANQPPPVLTTEERIAENNRLNDVFFIQEKKNFIEYSNSEKYKAQNKQDEMQYWSDYSQNHVFFPNKSALKLNDTMKEYRAKFSNDRYEAKEKIAEVNERILKNREKFLEKNGISMNQVKSK